MFSNAYNNWTLNASGIAAISKTGITKFAVRLSGDIDNSAPTYSAGAESHIFFHQSDRTTTQKPRLIVTYTSVTGSSVWQKDTSIDQIFVLYSQSAIDAYADTKAYMLGGMGNFIKLQRFMSLFSTVGSYNIEIGFNNGETNNFINYLVDLSGSGSAVWGSFSWADGTVWGGNVAKNYSWENVSSIRGYNCCIRGWV
ncbi:hypothetical protein M1146_07780 [Patescibacteria group bacterium]|nr:hypothetical protein [Patescibacteria group bacterium]